MNLTLPAISRDLARFIRTCPWLEGVPTPVLESLDPNTCHWRHFEAREQLYRDGETLSGVFGVQEGCFKIVNGSERGEAAILAVAPAGMWFGEILLFSGQPSFADCVAVERSRVLVMAATALHALSAAWPVINSNLLRDVSRKARSTFWMNVQYKTARPELLLARRLEVALDFGPSHGAAEWVELRERLSHELLAEMLGLSRPRVSLAMQALNAAGVLEARRGRVRVHVQRLRRYCRGEPALG